MKSPKDKLDQDDYDRIEEYISDALAEGFTMEAEDFEGRPCSYCGEVIPFTDWPEAVVKWDTPVQDPDQDEREPYIQRDYFCSEECKRQAKRDPEWIGDEDGRRHDDGDRIHKDELEANR